MDTKTEQAEYVKSLEGHSYLKITEAAAVAKKSRTTIYAAMDCGELQFLQSGSRYLIKREALDDWLERGAPR